MQLTRQTGDGAHEIRAFEPGRVRVEDRDFERSLIITPEAIVPDWPPQSVAELDDSHLPALLEHDPEVVLLGTGDRQHFPDARVFAYFQSRGIGFEVMDTAAACRTYNVLVSEARRVVAALML